MEQEFLTLQQLAAYLNMKPSTLYAMACEIPHYRLGRLLRFKKPEIDEWLTGRREAGPSTRESRRAQPLGPSEGPAQNINALIRNAIDEARSTRYTRSGKSARIKSVGKDGDNGLI
jgi:excisionase family DNA binding protein